MGLGWRMAACIARRRTPQRVPIAGVRRAQSHTLNAQIKKSLFARNWLRVSS
jgi:hypothetical protein